MVAVAAPPLAVRNTALRPREERGGSDEADGKARPELDELYEKWKPALRCPLHWPRRHLAQAQLCGDSLILEAGRWTAPVK